MSVSEKDNIHQLLKTIQASLAEQDKLDLFGATTEHADVLFEDDEQAPGVGADVSATMSAASTVHGASASTRDDGNATVNGSADDARTQHQRDAQAAVEVLITNEALSGNDVSERASR